MEMMLYDKIEPWNHNVEWYKPAIIAATIAETNRDKKKRSRPYTPHDMVPQWVKGTSSKKSPKEWHSLMKAYVMMHNAAVNKKKKRREGRMVDRGN